MTIVLNFITAIAWIWGGLMAIGAIAGIAGLLLGQWWGKEAADALAQVFMSGILAWAWLLARYVL